MNVTVGQCRLFRTLTGFKVLNFETSVQTKTSHHAQWGKMPLQTVRSFVTTSPSLNSLLSVKADRWRGIGLDSKQHFLDCSPEKLEEDLSAALSHWRSSSYRVVTAKVHECDSGLIPTLVTFGFSFHHAQPGYVYLKLWLSEEPDAFPAYANHFLGVAGLVVDEATDEMLVVRERFAVRDNIWKLPGGTADFGEDLHTVAEREVKEETGVDASFVGVVCFRHMHNFRYGCSDFYFVCHLRPNNKEITKDDTEIEECKWMKIDEYMEKQAPTAMNKHFIECYRSYLKQEEISGVIGRKSIWHHINKTNYNVYSLLSFENA